MLLSDFRIRNLDKLDGILVDLCGQVIRGQREHTDLGMVAAAVLDPDNNCVSAVNYPDQDGARVHAERAAMDAYLEQFGEIPPGSIIITTLSPCTEDMPDRHGESCTDLINRSGVHKVYAGYADPSQDEVRKKFHVMTTTNPRIRELCKAFADTFLKDHLDEVATVDVDDIHASALREHLLSNPALYEDRDDFQKMRHFLNAHKTPRPKVNNSYVYASVQSTPISKYINTAHFTKPQKLVKINDRYAYFNINGDIKRFPDTGTLSGDSMSEIYFFKSAQQLNHFNTLLQLKFPDYKTTSKILDQNQLDELSFLGSQCTKDCSGHRAGYEWSKRKGLKQGNSPWSPSFNKGAALAVAGK